jgi:glycosyltransferase involved in cell wall biosynthesis
MIKTFKVLTKPKAVVFYTYLPPWRIDVFNEMGQYYDLTIVFLNPNIEGFKYNKELLLKSLKVKSVFLDNGFTIGSKPFRFGIIRILNTIKPEIIFSHEYSPTSLLVSSLKRLNIFHFKYYITTSDNLSMAKSVGGLKSFVRKTVLSSADGIVVYTNNVSDWYKKNFNKLDVKVCPNIQNSQTLLSNKITFPSLSNSYINKYELKGSNIIIFVGRLVEEKGLKYLIQAFAESKHSDYYLVLVGDGNQKEYLVNLAKSLHIFDKVIFPGSFDGANLYVWYSMANFFVLPSIFEPFGAVVNEALVFGCPVLASKYIGALDFIQDQYNGFIFDPLNPSEFVSSLNDAMIMYKSFNIERKDLMIQSFEEYVKAFKLI